MLEELGTAALKNGKCHYDLVVSDLSRPNTHRHVFAIVVSHNRKFLLARCLESLKGQTVSLDCIIVVNNASTDGTTEWLAHQTTNWGNRLITVHLPQNLGGAGGFNAGMQAAVASGCGWLWLMDDDAEPAPDALECLLAQVKAKNQVLGSIEGRDGPQGRELCWPPFATDCKPALFAHDLPGPLVEVQGLPFLGFLIHRSVVEQVGLPDGSLFLSLDDVEYCERLKRTEVRFFLVRDSFISHPLPKRRILRLPGRTLVLIRQAPWKNYYNARNRLIVGRRYYGRRLWTATLPSVLLRMFFAVLYGPFPRQQFAAYCRAIVDGLKGRTGLRVALP